MDEASYSQVLSIGVVSTLLGSEMTLVPADLSELLGQFQDALGVQLGISEATANWVLQAVAPAMKDVLVQQKKAAVSSKANIQGIFSSQLPALAEPSEQEKLLELANQKFDMTESGIAMGNKNVPYSEVSKAMGCSETEFKKVISQQAGQEEAFSIARKMAKPLLMAALVGGVSVLLNVPLDLAPPEIVQLKTTIEQAYGKGDNFEMNRLIKDFETWALQGIPKK